MKPAPGAAFAFLLLALAVGCQPAGPSRPHVSLSSSLDSLRAAFNADSGTVRAVILVSPT